MGNLDTLLVFGSTTGTTRMLAGSVKKGLQNAGISVQAKNVARVRIVDIPRYPLLFVGSSTWENGCLQKDVQSFLERLGGLRLDGTRAAVFGPGSRTYPHFCRAVDVLEEELVRRGASLLNPSLRIDGSGYSMRELALRWAEGIGRSLA